LRTLAGLTQEQLADRSGVPVGTLRGYEQGRREPLWDAFLRLARALGVACEAFADCEAGRVTAAPPAKGKKTYGGKGDQAKPKGKRS